MKANNCWIINARELSEGQVSDLGRFLGPVTTNGKLKDVLVGYGWSEDFQIRLAALPNRGSLRVVVDESVKEVPQGGAFCFDFLKTLHVSMRSLDARDRRLNKSPQPQAILLMGHDTTNPKDAIKKWAELAKGGEFGGSHLIVNICNIKPARLIRFCELALQNGAKSIVVATSKIDVPCYTFAAYELTREAYDLSEPLSMWSACYTRVHEDMMKCLGELYDGKAEKLVAKVPAELEKKAVDAILRKWPDVGKSKGLSAHLLTDDGKGLKRAEINQLLLMLKKQGSLFMWLAEGRSPDLDRNGKPPVASAIGGFYDDQAASLVVFGPTTPGQG
jgi:hypothetical protein